MIGKVRKLVPDSVINYGKHFPEALVASVRYGFPGRKLRVIGVTGTDGKTTTVNMIYKILKDAGKKVSMISTINAVVAGKVYDTGFHVTSPDRGDVQSFLSQSVSHQDEFMVLEVTSHGLAQFRVWGIPFEVGVLTNVTHEHLDYHKTFANYFQTKMKLIKVAKVGIINQSLRGERGNMGDKRKRLVSFGLHKGDFNQEKLKLKLKLPGEYNIENALAALAVTTELGIDPKIARKTLESFSGLNGRMEEIKNNRGIKVVVDFAHTPNALEQALQTLRKETKGKLIAVFGAASERDVAKRPLMGEISSKLADITILTDEDPRFEDRSKIINHIASGMKGAAEGRNLFKEPDRKKAIKMALAIAKKGDTVGIFGKGHEKSMNYLGKEKPWSDQEAVKEVLCSD